MNSLIAIVGPTASGKTDLAFEIAKKYHGEIICADSRTIYKELIIGTASPILGKEYKIKKSRWGNVYLIDGVRHYLLHFVEPGYVFTVAEFQQMAEKIIQDIQARKKLPLLVGGTGLYIDSIIKGFKIPQSPPDLELRARLEKERVENLYYQLQKLDLAAASKIEPNNKRRIIRALEVFLNTGIRFSEQQKLKKPHFKILTIGILMSREKLYKKINQRVEKLIKLGFIEEVEKLIKKGYNLALPAMSGLGYKQIYNHLVNKDPETLQDTVYLIKRDTRHFARRQISWFKRNKSIKWVKNEKEAEKLIDKFLR